MVKSELIEYVEQAADEHNKIAALIAVLIVRREDFVEHSASEICEDFGMPDTYKHQLRSILKARDEIKKLGYEIKEVVNEKV